MIFLRERLCMLTGGIRDLGNEKVMIYGIVLYKEASEKRFLFLDSMSSE